MPPQTASRYQSIRAHESSLKPTSGPLTRLQFFKPPLTNRADLRHRSPGLPLRLKPANVAGMHYTPGVSPAATSGTKPRTRELQQPPWAAAAIGEGAFRLAAQPKVAPGIRKAFLMQPRWRQATQLLAEHLKMPRSVLIKTPGEAWIGVIEVLAPLVRPARVRPPQVTPPSTGELFLDPAWCATCTLEELESGLQHTRRRTSHGAAVQAVARWWQARIAPLIAADLEGEVESVGWSALNPDPEPVEAADGWDGSTHRGWRVQLSEGEWDELTRLRGLTRSAAEELRLLLGAEIFPFQRGVLRVGCRHGWFDESTDRESTQHLLGLWADDAGLDRRILWSWLLEVAQRWCGRNPDCGQCPLEEALPPRGPIALAEE